ncbi:hypothetical protein PN462_11320 [Spirulina sp. CS-785/01]|uniref:LamG-like jellyroll fold domain-containing protein n=1 Tax=Spirulina sp. CS-785/01 TaxID=3021716 RepID=UPI00232B54BB|nr:LamG-like jellyroll fold domain-containing protein [Spirulina sp. CS-785/01]MDB9313691.1 hypothetical protein [Spirulina sp. CS-785/01]
MSIISNFVKTYTDKNYQYTATVTHKGTVIAFAMDEERRIYYSVLNLDNTNSETQSTGNTHQKTKSPLDVNYWLNNPKELQFPNEIVQVGYAILPNQSMPTVKKGTRDEAKAGTLRPEEIDPFLSTTARFTANAHFQVLSDGKFIYLFRQAIDNDHPDMLYKRDKKGDFVLDQSQQKVPLVNETLLLDRYVLAGTELKPKMEVRYQRSRHKYTPQTNKDGLGAKDLEKKPFFEPTQELDFVQNLKEGRFNVLLVPTQIANLERWQVFSHNSKTGRIDSFNIERSQDGLFNTKGTQLYTSPDPQYQNSVLERQPGTDSFTGEPLIPLISKSGYAESALKFDGSDDYIELPTNSLPTGEEITVSFWAYGGDKLPMRTAILGATDANGHKVFCIHLPWSNSRIYFDCGNDGSQCDRIDKAAQTSEFQGVWSHWAFTKNAQTGEMKIYLNGQLWHSGTGKTRQLNPATKVLLGNYPNRSYPYHGIVDEIRIWNRVRTQTEIQAEMNHRLVGNEPGLWSYWRLDEGKGETIFDQTDNGHHGTIKDATWVKSDAPIGDHPGIRRTSFGLQSVAEQFALQFDGQDDYAIIQLGSPWQAPQEFSVEMWVKPDATDQVSYTGLFSSNNANRTGSSFQIDLDGQGNYRFLHDKGGWQIGKAATDWQHLAVAYDGNTLTAYLDGRKLGSGAGNLPTEFRYYILGVNRSVDRFFQGQMEEVRIWKRAISAAEIQQNLHSRLTGKENGLMAYFPCTEGSGNLLHDKTVNAHHATLKGTTWVKSTSPISDVTQVSEERTIASGLSALLYHQQEKATTGYEQQEKPVKRNARVMLAVATGTKNTTATERKYIAALDFGVSREGKLTQVPDQLMLPNLQASNAANQDLDAVSRLQEEIATLTASINQLEIEIAALKLSTQEIATLEAQKTKLEGEIQNLEADLENKQKDVFNYFCRIESGNYAGWYLATDSNGNLGVTSSGGWNNLWAFGEGYLDSSLGYSQSKSISPQTPSGRYLSNNGDGSLSLDTSPHSVFESWFPVQSGSNYKLKSLGSGIHSRPTYYLFGMMGAAGLTQDANNVLCNWKIVKTNQALPVITNAENKLNNKKAELQQVVDELNALYQEREQLKDKEGQLALQKIQLDNKETELEFMQSGIQGEVALPMSLLHTDPFGLTVSGGLLNFAYTKDTPLLVNSATGKLALYFRGVEEQFFVTYYDTNTTKARYLLEADSGKVMAIARSAEPECDRAQFTITNGNTPNTCTLTINNKATGVQETWQNVPRDLQKFADTLNGRLTQPIFIGKLAQPAIGNISNLVLHQKVKQSLTKGAILSLNNTKVTVSQAVNGGLDTISITPTTLNSPPDTPLYLLSYDYDAWTSSNRTKNPLTNGSLQFLFQPSTSEGNIKNGTVTDSEITLSCQWVAESPGRALAFDGKEDRVVLGDLQKLSQLDAHGDLTLEAWVRPAQLADTARVIHHHSAQSQYTLGVKSKSASFQSALELDGVNDFVELPPDSIPTGQEITVSFWAFGGNKLPNKNSVLEALDANGQRVINIHFPWDNSNIYFDCGNSGGGYDRIYKTAQPSDFKGVWSHWAFTKNAATGDMKIYLNGTLWHSGTGKTNA